MPCRSLLVLLLLLASCSGGDQPKECIPGVDDGCLGTCGDGYRVASEECEDGNLEDGDGCSSQCLIERCGDGHRAPHEACDDGNLEDGDGCRSDCTIETCGDALLDPDEECDDGDGNGNDPDACRLQCVLPVCGDGVVDTGEACEAPFGDFADMCRPGCVAPSCGDHVVDTGEECDPVAVGGMSDTKPDHCRTNCLKAHCGDGVVDTFEQCDDGNTRPGDGCSPDCRHPICGDEVLDRGELCFAPVETTDGWSGAAFATLARLDTDAYPELVVTAPAAGVFRVYEGLPGGGFNPTSPTTAGTSPGPIVSDDLDGDGDIDVLIASAAGLEPWLNNGNGFLEAGPVLAVDTTLTSLGRAQLDDDPLLETFGVGQDRTVRIFDRVDGALTQVASLNAGATLSGGIAADLNGDGQLELVFAAPASDALVIFRRFGGAWTDPQLLFLIQGSSKPNAVAAADLDDDGDLDLIVAETGLAGIVWLVNSGDGLFVDALEHRTVTGISPVALLALDLSGDGHADVAVVDEARDEVRVLQGDGTGRLVSQAPLSVGQAPGWIVAGDTNGDERPDLVVVNRGDGTISRIASSR